MASQTSIPARQLDFQAINRAFELVRPAWLNEERPHIIVAMRVKLSPSVTLVHAEAGLVWQTGNLNVGACFDELKRQTRHQL